MAVRDDGSPESARLADLGKAIKIRRELMQLGQARLEARGGPGEATIRRLERGEAAPPRPRTRHQIELALAWAPDMVTKILNGDMGDIPKTNVYIRTERLASALRDSGIRDLPADGLRVGATLGAEGDLLRQVLAITATVNEAVGPLDDPLLRLTPDVLREHPVVFVDPRTGGEFAVDNPADVHNTAARGYFLKEATPGLNVRVYQPPSGTVEVLNPTDFAERQVAAAANDLRKAQAAAGADRLSADADRAVKAAMDGLRASSSFYALRDGSETAAMTVSKMFAGLVSQNTAVNHWQQIVASIMPKPIEIPALAALPKISSAFALPLLSPDFLQKLNRMDELHVELEKQPWFQGDAPYRLQVARLRHEQEHGPLPEDEDAEFHEAVARWRYKREHDQDADPDLLDAEESPDGTWGVAELDDGDEGALRLVEEDPEVLEGEVLLGPWAAVVTAQQELGDVDTLSLATELFHRVTHNPPSEERTDQMQVLNDLIHGLLPERRPRRRELDPPRSNHAAGA